MIVPTAEDFLQDHHQISHFYDDKTNNMVCFSDDVQKAMIEFAKLHVETALHIASERADLTDNGSFPYVDKLSILKSYPLNKIK